MTLPPASRARWDRSRPPAKGGTVGSKPRKPRRRSLRTNIDTGDTKATSRTTSYCSRSNSPGSSPEYGSPKASVADPTESSRSSSPVTRTFDPETDASLRMVSVTSDDKASGRGWVSPWTNHTYDDPSGSVSRIRLIEDAKA